MAKTPSQDARWLEARLHEAARDSKDRKVGLEIERIGIFRDGAPINYAGSSALLQELARRHGWKLDLNAEGRPLGLDSPFGNLSLEPGSQLEISTLPGRDLSDVAEKTGRLENLIDISAREMSLTFSHASVHPTADLDSIDLIDSSRYRVMTDYLSRRDTMGLQMMRLTSSVQVNLDYSTEAEAIDMLRTALLAAPLSYALFANSPISNGKLTNFLSFREEIWRHTDTDRTGLFPRAFEKGFGFKEYADFAWHNPLMFARNENSEFVKTDGASLSDISSSKLSGVTTTEENLLSSISQLFFEARLRPGYVEVRSIDGLGPQDRYGAAAFWVGILYSESVRREIQDRFSRVTFNELRSLLELSSRVGLRAKVGGTTLQELAREVLALVSSSLRLRGRDEEKWLLPVQAIVGENKNPAQRTVEALQNQPPANLKKIMEVVGFDPKPAEMHPESDLLDFPPEPLAREVPSET